MMALYLKQDFAPPVLSRRWIAMKFRPNMLLYNRHHIISILESGLLFREDSVEVEQDSPSVEDVWRAAGGGKGGWLTRGERVASLCVVAGCLLMFPPRSIQKSTLIHLATYITLPVALRTCHRLACRGSLSDLLAVMRDYLALARRAAACLRECAALRAELGSVSSAIESTHTMLCRQQSSLAVVMSRASSALLGNAPWLRSDVAWDAVARDAKDADNLLKIHHAFLVVQSTLLKHIAMAHYIPSKYAQKLYKNHNERIYWIHSVLIPHLNEDFKQNFEALERMYRLLKNYGNSDTNVIKKPGTAISDSWLYSDVHSGIARASLELKLALNKCNNLDMFLDSCALNKQDLDLDILNKDLDNVIEYIIKCLTSAQNSQIRLKKLQNKFGITDKLESEELIEDEREILRIDDKEPETKDEVFYFVKTEDDETVIQPTADISTGPGKKETETTKIVLNELKRKLVKREDVMRERERQALAKTMPELRNNIPEFPRQIIDVEDRKGFITKLPKKISKRRLLKHYKINNKPKNGFRKYKLKTEKYKDEGEIKNTLYEANSSFNTKSKLLSFLLSKNNNVIVTEWSKQSMEKDKDLDSSGLSEGLSDVEGEAMNQSVNQAVNHNQSVNHENNGEARNYRFSKRDLELSPSSSESDIEFYNKQVALLKDIRKHRVVKKKNHPDKKGNIPSDKTVDESLRPIEYSFGTGMAMASVLQINSAARIPHMAREEVFTGDGEVSLDSGNDEDA